jgi:AmmeMemoRadiSam system protein A
MSLDTATQHALLALVRSSIGVVLGTVREPALADVPLLRERRGAFVSLHAHGRLRGCIGRIDPDAPLAIMLPDVARLAAMSDPRFPPLAVRELDVVRIEISLLTPPVPVDDPLNVVVGRDGIIVAARGRRGLLLPQVAVEFGWTVEEFLACACEKASLPADAWRHDGVRVSVFQAEVFGEED